MNYKLFTLLILSLNLQAQPIQKTIILLDHLHEAQAYWELIARDKNSFWKLPPHQWSSKTWKAETISHQKTLAAQRAELINTLGILAENPKTLAHSSVSKLHKRTVRTLAQHGAPSHFKRQWLSYAGITTGAAILAFYLHQSPYMHNHGIDALKNLYTSFKNEPESNIFAANGKNNEQLYEDTVTQVLINASTVDQTAPLMSQALNGKKIPELTFPEKQKIFLKLTAEIGNALNIEIKQVGGFLSDKNQKNKFSEQSTRFFTPIKDNGRYPDIYRRSIPLINLIGTYANLINHLTEKSHRLIGLIVQILTTNALELKLKETSFTHTAHKAMHDAKLALPLMVGAYLGYLGASSIYRHTTTLTILTPLKTDLVSLQLLLNKERYTHDRSALSIEFKGECFYWVQRLHRYKDRLPTAYRATYRRYLDDLENQTLVPEQKMTIITSLFHELEPLFKRD
jgi:hypothetical protein